MAFALKLHFRTHHEIPSISFNNIVRNQQAAPLFKVQPIQTTGLSHSHFQSRRKSIYGFNASYIQGLEQSNNNGGGGGDGVDDKRKDRGGGGDGDGRGDACAREVLRFFFRFAEFLFFSNVWDNNTVGVVGYLRNLAWLCGQAMWQLYLAMLEICCALVMVACFGVVFILSFFLTLFEG